VGFEFFYFRIGLSKLGRVARKYAWQSFVDQAMHVDYRDRVDAGRKLSTSAGGAGRDGFCAEVETRLSKRNASASDEVRTFLFTMRDLSSYCFQVCAAAIASAAPPGWPET